MEVEGNRHRLYNIGGEYRTISDWCRLKHIGYGAVMYRMHHKGENFYDVIKALEEEKNKDRNRSVPKCSKCAYSEIIDHKPVCMYLVLHVPPQRRPCPPENCTVFEPKGRRRVNKGKMK